MRRKISHRPTASSATGKTQAPQPATLPIALIQAPVTVPFVEEIKEKAIVLIPQNAEWTNTSQMVKEIAKVTGKKVRLVGGIMKLAVLIGGKVPGKIGGLVNKAFGNSCYCHEISFYAGIPYQKVNLKELKVLFILMV